MLTKEGMDSFQKRFIIDDVEQPAMLDEMDDLDISMLMDPEFINSEVDIENLLEESYLNWIQY